MVKLPEKLPETVAELQQLVWMLAEQADRQIAALEEVIVLLRHKRFGTKSEKMNQPFLPGLFDDEEEIQALLEQQEEEEITVPAHTRKRGKRKNLPESLPRVETVIDLTDEEKVCSCHGQPMVCIGEEVTEQLDVIPAKVQVQRIVRKKYACGHKECGQMLTPPMPPQPLPKTMASAGLIAWLIVSKYLDGLPLYRLERSLKRMGAEVSRITLAHWMIKIGVLVQPLINLLKETAIGYDYAALDETRCQVLKEAGRTPQSQSWMWVLCGGPPEQPVIIYHYSASRGQEVPLMLLEGFEGFLQTDGYSGYNGAARVSAIIILGCWDHARRKFDEAIKAQGKGVMESHAMRFMALIQKLYRIEKKAKDLSPEERFWIRLQLSVPVLHSIRTQLETVRPSVPPQSLLGKALTYLDNQWPSLIIFLMDGRLRLSNIYVENKVRPFALGRKNWLFFDSVAGAIASANLYSLMETAKACGLEPYEYFRLVLSDLPKAKTLEEVEALLPWNVKRRLESGERTV